MANKLAKLADLQDLANMREATEDARFTALLVAVTAAAARLMGREQIMRQVDLVEYPAVYPARYSRFARLDVLPIESVTSVKASSMPATDAEFEVLTALVENTDYVVNASRGNLERLNAAWWLGVRRLQVTYTAGWIDPDTAVVPDGALLPPEDLQRAIVVECARRINVDARAGLRQVDQGQGGGGWMAKDVDVHPDLVAACAPWRRVTV